MKKKKKKKKENIKEMLSEPNYFHKVTSLFSFIRFLFTSLENSLNTLGLSGIFYPN